MVMLPENIYVHQVTLICELMYILLFSWLYLLVYKIYISGVCQGRFVRKVCMCISDLINKVNLITRRLVLPSDARAYQGPVPLP